MQANARAGINGSLPDSGTRPLRTIRFSPNPTTMSAASSKHVTSFSTGVAHPQEDIWDNDLSKRMNDKMEEFQRRSNDFFRHPAEFKRSENIKGHMEKQADGSIVYRVVFDVQGYTAEDLKTSLIGDRVVQVAGRALINDPISGKQTTMSFEEQFTLPENVDPYHLRSVVSNNQLVVTAPVLPPSYPAIGSRSSSSSLRSPASPFSSTMSSRSMSPTYSALPTPGAVQPAQHGPGVRKVSLYHLEVDLGKEFAPSDVRIVTEGTRLTVHGQRQIKAAGKTSFREFRDEFDLPANVDLTKMTAKLRNDGKIIIEALFRTEQDLGFDFQNLSIIHQ